MAENAYGIKEHYQIEWAVSVDGIGALRRCGESAFEVATIEQVHIMLQHLLAERFGLVVHREARQLPGFRLVVAKGGVKLTRSVEMSTSDAPASAIAGVRPEHSHQEWNYAVRG